PCSLDSPVPSSVPVAPPPVPPPPPPANPFEPPEGFLSPPIMANPTTARTTTARPPPSAATSFLDFFLASPDAGSAFFFPSSPFSRLRSPLGMTPAGSSTLNRYLHLEHSTFVAITFGLLISTWCSQLGHGTLKLAMKPPREFDPCDVAATG